MADAQNIDAKIIRLYETISDRIGSDPNSSYTAQLFDGGNEKIAQKLGEEAVETVIATVAKDREAMISESADLLYHLLVAWVFLGVTPDHVLSELEMREGISGISEKAAREKL